MKANFETIAAGIAFVVNGGSLTALASLLDAQELRDLKTELGGLIVTRLSNPDYVRRVRGYLLRKLVSLGFILLHILNVSILAIVALVLWRGPENIRLGGAGPIADPLSLLDKVLFGAWLLVSGLVYLVKCFGPTFRLAALYRSAGRWVRTNDRRR